VSVVIGAFAYRPFYQGDLLTAVFERRRDGAAAVGKNVTQRSSP